MELILLIIHLFLAMALVGVILLQKSEGGALGIGGGGGMGGFLTARGAANLLTRTTAILATLFIITSLVLALMASRKHSASASSGSSPGRRTRESLFCSIAATSFPFLRIAHAVSESKPPIPRMIIVRRRVSFRFSPRCRAA